MSLTSRESSEIEEIPGRGHSLTIDFVGRFAPAT